MTKKLMKRLQRREVRNMLRLIKILNYESQITEIEEKNKLFLTVDNWQFAVHLYAH